MKKAQFLWLLFSIFNYQYIAAQTDDSSDFKRFQIGVSFSPDVNYRTLTSQSNVNWIRENRDEQEIPTFGFTTGINAVFKITKMFGVETGVLYSQKGYQNKWQDGLNPIQPNDPNIPKRVKSVDRFHYLDIPVKGNIIVGKRKVRFIGSLGIVVNVYLTSSWTGISESHSGDITRTITQEPYDYEAVNVSPLVSAGIDWKLSNRMNLQVKPTFRYGVLSVIDAPIKGFLWNGGIDIVWLFGL